MAFFELQVWFEIEVLFSDSIIRFKSLKKMSTPQPGSHWSSKSKWGPLFWQLGHLVSFAYADSNPSNEQREQTARFYESLASVLPCEECKGDYAQLLEKNPVRNHLKNRETLSRWFYDIHNQVNAKLGKPITLSYEKVKEMYLSCQSHKEEVQHCKRSSNSKNILILFLVVALVAIIGYAVATRK